MIEALLSFGTLLAIEIASSHRPHYPEKSEDYGPTLRAALKAFSKVDPYRHIEATLGATAFRNRIAALFDDIDVLLTLVASISAPPLNAATPDPATFQDIAEGRGQILAYRFTCLWNLARTPAISIPWALDSSGMPIGIQLVARCGDDERLLSVAERLHCEAPARETRPPCS